MLAAPLRGQDAPRQASPAIQGAVTDTSGTPLPYCYVRLAAAQSSILCDQAGRFLLLDVRPGRNAIEVRRLGYVPGQFTVEVPDSGLVVAIQLVPLPTLLQPVTVTAPGGLTPSLVENGFYERMGLRTGTGSYITPQEIERLHPQHTTQLLSDRPALKMGYTGRFAVPWDRNGDCIMNTFVDGIEIKNLYGTDTGQRTGRRLPLMSSLTQYRPPAPVEGIGIDDFISPDAVAAIEIYPSGPGVPQQFQVFGSCGAIVIWTKRGAPAAVAAESTVAGQPGWVSELGYRAEEVFPARRGRLGMPFVDVMVGRRLETVLFDTGDMVGLSLATPRLDALNLPETGRWESRDADGRVIGTFRKVRAPFVLLFGQAVVDPTVYEIADTALGGLVGPDALPGTRFTLDYQAEKLALSRSPLRDVPPGFFVLPLVRSARHPRLILAMGRVNGRPILLEFDTGASRTVIDPALARDLGLERTADGVRIDSLAVGSLVFAVPSAKESVQSDIDPTLTPPIQISVGTNVLSQLLLTVDYAGGQMLIRAAR